MLSGFLEHRLRVRPYGEARMDTPIGFIAEREAAEVRRKGMDQVGTSLMFAENRRG